MILEVVHDSIRKLLWDLSAIKFSKHQKTSGGNSLCFVSLFMRKISVLRIVLTLSPMALFFIHAIFLFKNGDCDVWD